MKNVIIFSFFVIIGCAKKSIIKPEQYDAVVGQLAEAKKSIYETKKQIEVEATMRANAESKLNDVMRMYESCKIINNGIEKCSKGCR